MADEVRKAVEKVEKLVKALAADIGDVKRRSSAHDKRFDALEKLIADDRKELEIAMREIATSQSSMASAMTQAMAQLTLAQSLEKRVERLEAMVFPPKH